MELLDRYLQAVRKYLPKRQQDDIIKELSDNLLSQIEDKAEGLGRPLTDEELSALLKHHGHPLAVAVRYQPHQYLISPTIFPFYLFTLKLALLFSAGIYALVNTLLLILGQPGAVGIIQIALGIPKVLWITAAWVTLSFAALEIAITRYNVKVSCFDNWDPHSLPAVETAARSEKHRPIPDFLGSLSLLLWMLAVVNYPFILLGPGAYYLRSAEIEPAPIWHTLYWPLLGLLFANVLVKAAYLFPFTWRWSRRAIELAFRLAGLVLLSLLVQTPQLFVVGHPAAEALARTQEEVKNLNYALMIGLRIVVVIVSLHLVWDGVKMLLESVRNTGKYLAMKM